MSFSGLAVCPVRAHYRDEARRAASAFASTLSSEEDNQVEPYAERVAPLAGDSFTHALLCSSYCPVWTCRALSTLCDRDNRSAALDWLREQVGTLMRSNVLSSSARQANRALVAQWRELESIFQVDLVWQGYEPTDSEYSSSRRRMVTSAAVIRHYVQQAGVPSLCRRSGPCPLHISGVMKRVYSLGPQGRGAEYHTSSQVDFGSMSKDEMALWSIGVSLVSYIVLSIALGDSTCEDTSHTLWLLWWQQVQACRAHGSVSRLSDVDDPPPPPYDGDDQEESDECSSSSESSSVYSY